VQSVCSGAGLNRSMVHVGCVSLFGGRTGEDNLGPIIGIEGRRMGRLTLM